MATRTIQIELPPDVYRHFEEKARLERHDDVSHYLSKTLHRVSLVEAAGRYTAPEMLREVARLPWDFRAPNTPIFCRPEQVFQSKQRPNEAYLKSLFPADLQEPLDALSLLDDSSLHKVVADGFPEAASHRLEDLHLKAQRSSLTDEEIEEQTRLMESHERLMVLRAEAAFLLSTRGHDVASS